MVALGYLFWHIENGLSSRGHGCCQPHCILRVTSMSGLAMAMIVLTSLVHLYTHPFLSMGGLAMAVIDEADTIRKIKKIRLPPKRGQVKGEVCNDMPYWKLLELGNHDYDPTQ
ncbi:hypothetical protein M9H77_24673 [Catharanthus roseus]|uniref:Uncharacterized protein n=1 Tax=Catharanthus roseus TaxID=4058 RepID=A0ACC0AWV3_CATRO|nr:hypothetical protein M9H77_24673 [Catharanthus roseus]